MGRRWARRVCDSRSPHQCLLCLGDQTKWVSGPAPWGPPGNPQPCAGEVGCGLGRQRLGLSPVLGLLRLCLTSRQTEAVCAVHPSGPRLWALRPGPALSSEAPQARDVGLSTRRELGLGAGSKVVPGVGGGGILSPEAPHRSTWRMLSQNQGGGPGCGLWLPPPSSWMKGAPVPSSGPTPPPQVPVASRPHGSSSGLDGGTEAP